MVESVVVDSEVVKDDGVKCAKNSAGVVQVGVVQVEMVQVDVLRLGRMRPKAPPEVKRKAVGVAVACAAARDKGDEINGGKEGVMGKAMDMAVNKDKSGVGVFAQMAGCLAQWRPEPAPVVNPGRKLDGSQVRRIYRMWAAGEAVADIAEILSLPAETVARQLRAQKAG